MNFSQCQGCIELEAGRGGENQMEHMLEGGCLYEDENDHETKAENADESDDENDTECEEEKLDAIEIKPVLQKVNCLVCHEEPTEEQQVLSSFICSACESNEDKQREIRYQSFMVSNY